jgi:hypothetical protein
MIMQTVQQAVIYALLLFIAGNAVWQAYTAARWLIRYPEIEYAVTELLAPETAE